VATPRSLRRILAIGLLLSLIVVSCGGSDRPTVEEWRPVWTSYVAEVPTRAELGDPPDRTVCSTALGVLRERSGEVTPTPDQAIDGVVSEWISVAEDLLFECPPSSTKIPDLEFAYAELFRLQSEIDVVLEIDEAGT
jgi:hypothetical protein